VHQDLTPKQREEKQINAAIEKQTSSRKKRPCHMPRKHCEVERMLECRDNLRCLYPNACSLIGKFDHFESWIYSINPYVIAITERWTNQHILDAEISLPGYTLFCKDRPGNILTSGIMWM